MPLSPRQLNAQPHLNVRIASKSKLIKLENAVGSVTLVETVDHACAQKEMTKRSIERAKAHAILSKQQKVVSSVARRQQRNPQQARAPENRKPTSSSVPQSLMRKVERLTPALPPHSCFSIGSQANLSVEAKTPILVEVLPAKCFKGEIEQIDSTLVALTSNRGGADKPVLLDSQQTQDLKN